ncbi:MAG: hypothetical protein U0163_14265 [Gemmatimonadaceae bacterium]
MSGTPRALCVAAGTSSDRLNGKKLLEYELWSADWKAKVKASKFNEWPEYGWQRSGTSPSRAIDASWRWNIRIRELK